MLNEAAWNGIMRAVLVMSISGSAVAAILFAIKPIIRNRIPKAAQYCLWLIVIAALLVPVSRLVMLPAGSGAPIINAMPAGVVERYAVTSEEVMTRLNQIAPMYLEVDENEYLRMVNQAGSPIAPAIDILSLVYPIAVMAILLCHIIAYTIFIRKIRRNNKAAGIGCQIPVYLNAKAKTPMLVGVLRPSIILPDCKYTDAQLRAVLLHELTHLRRKDVLVKWLSVLACAIHWFNPIVWLVRREIDRACELACDEAAVRNLDADGKQTYGNTLICVAADSKMPSTILSTTMCEEKKALKERLGAIMKSRKHTRLTIAASVLLLAAATLTACALGAGRAATSNLIEFEAIYHNVTEHSYGVYFRHGDYYYTGYVVDGLAQSAGGTRGLKEIGFAAGDFSGTVREGQKGHRYKIFEREGYSIEEFIIMSDGVFMNPATIYVASLAPPDPEPIRTGPISLGTYSTDDGMVQVVLLNGGEFYIVRRATSYSPTGTWSISAGERLTLTVSEDEQHIFVHNGGSITFQSGAWLENWIEPGTVLTLTERWA